jgi:hypothetical protein
MFGTLPPGSADGVALKQVQAWVRQQFRLPPQAVVMVTELACQLPGCPPLETVITFWDAPEATIRHHYKIFKPVAQVQQDDLPPWWMKDALTALPDWVCSCC